MNGLDPTAFVRAHPLLLLVATLAGAVAVLTWRVQETRTPVTTRKIVVPPLGMSTGFLMFVVPAARVPWSWAGTAFAAGALVLSWPLSRTSRLERQGDAIVLKPSRAFLWILLGLLAVRMAAREWVEQRVTPVQTGAVFFILAFGMILRWRVAMLLEYRRLRAATAPAPAGPPA